MSFNYNLSKLDSELLSGIEEDVKNTFEIEAILSMNFETFFDEVDVIQAYEPDWNPKKYKPYYFVVFNNIKKGRIV
jgi:hypothetical protein